MSLLHGVSTMIDFHFVGRAWICGAKTRSSTGEPCQNYPMANGRCRMHGGLSLKGEASPRYKHGRYCQKGTKAERIMARLLKDAESHQS